MKACRIRSTTLDDALQDVVDAIAFLLEDFGVE